MKKRQQLPLPFAAPKRCTFANFLGISNDELIGVLSRPQQTFAFIWLYGPSGVGKSHLLRATVDAQIGFGRTAVYVDRAQQGLPELSLDAQVLAIDHLPSDGLKPEEEKLLVALYQSLSVRGGWLVVSCDVSPLAGRWNLPDLASRLHSAQTFAVEPLDEAQVRVLLARWARERGLSLPKPVVDYWLTRRNRSLTALHRDLELLDEAAWVEQRRLTVPFMKGVLESRAGEA